jgi:hypothetical protein
MENLVAALREIDASDLPDMGEEDIILRNENHPRVHEVEGLASDLFIDEEAKPKFYLMDELYHTHGYFIVPGERDRFGWLSGMLQTKKGFVIFG